MARAGRGRPQPGPGRAKLKGRGRRIERHQTAHNAICTGFMALGMMIPGLWSGWLQDHIGYRNFFSWVILATIPSFIVAAFLPLEASFGKAADAPAEAT